jgi:hypothetical protein
MTGYDIDNYLFELVNTEQITIQAYAVGHYIKKIQNFKNIDIFTVMLSSMATTLNISRQSASKYFDELIAVGYVEIIESINKKGFKIQLHVNVDVNVHVNGHVKNFNTKVNTLKKEEQKTKNKTLNNNNKSTMERFEQLKPSDCKEYIQEQIQHHKEQIQMSLNISEEKITRSLDYFISHYEVQNQIYNFKSDSWKHFFNWIKSYDIDKQLKQPKNKVIFEKKSKRFETFEELKKSVNGNT